MALTGVFLFAILILWSVAHAFGEPLDDAENKLMGIGLVVFFLVVLVSLYIKFRG